MKILFASLPADGHFNPLTPIAAQLAAAGHDVRWYAGPQYAPKVAALGMQCYPYVQATEITADNLDTLFPERRGLRGPKLISFDLEKFFVASVADHFADITAIRDDFAFDVFCCDGALYAEKLVAECLDVPVFAVSLSTVLPTRSSPPPFFGARPARTPVGKAAHAVVRRLLTSTMKRGVQTYNAVLTGHGLAPIAPDGFPDAPLAAARRVFLNGSPGLEFPGYQPPANAEFVGVLEPVRAALADAAPLPAVVTDPARRVVVVSQGTVGNTDPNQLLAPALEALAGGPHVVVATTGGTQTDELRARFAAPNVVIEDFLDYDELFAHADVFVTNGGYGSLLAALRQGVPIVGAGREAGRNDNNARVAHNGLGVDLRTEHPKPAQIAAAVDRVLADTQVARNVARLQAELASYDPMGIIEKALAGL